ncbi:MAG: YihY/virulence factor BrkB family protein [Bdellovibrionaceae bacterium]|nr:YihY/virulence factor BrkB family protein [Pseudobdellovibrionaceae bacterium]MBX3032365.1 YihY/virulence factor BrkB family protein [Pseudobdellovibrionaceae bacterium]
MVGLRKRVSLRRFRRATAATLVNVRDAEIPLISAALAFSTLLSLIPFVAVTLSILKGFVGFSFLEARLEILFVSFFKGLAGNEAGQIVRRLLTRLLERSWGLSSALVLFFTSFGIFWGVEDAVNRIWGTRRERRWWRRLFLILGFYLLVPVGMALYAALRSIDNLKPLFAWSPLFWDGAFAFIALLLINRMLPATHVRWRMALLGSLMSTAGLLVLMSSFTWLTKSVFNYSKMYGSVAALPILCLWILTAWQIILTGVAFAAGLTRTSNPPRVGPIATP